MHIDASRQLTVSGASRVFLPDPLSDIMQDLRTHSGLIPFRKPMHIDAAQNTVSSKQLIRPC